MSHRQNVEENLQRFAEGIGLEELRLNEYNACGLCFDDTLIVNMEYLEEDEALVFVSSIQKLEDHMAESEKLKLFNDLLFINLQFPNMQGAFMSLNHEKNEVLIIRCLNAGLDYGTFESSLEKFVNTLEWVTAEINGQGEVTNNNNNSQGGDNKQPPQSPPMGGGDMGIMV